MFRFLVAGLAVLALACTGSRATARPFTVDDLLHQASLGATALDPAGRWVVFEQRDRYDTGRRYDYNTSTSLSLGRLRVLDLDRRSPPRPLLAHDPGPGVAISAFSPSGSKLAVFRLHDRRWSFGVVTLVTGATRWWPITPEEPGRGRVVQWLSDTEVLLIQRTDDLGPEAQHSGWVIGDRLPRYIAAASGGAGAHTVLGSGVYASLRARAPPNRLLRINVITGRAAVLATGELRDLELSPDHRHLALLAAGADVQSREDGPVRGPAGLETEVSSLSVLDLGTGERRELCIGCDVLPQLLSWSPSGAAILVFARGPDGLWTSGRLLKLDLVSGTSARLGADLALHTDLNPVTVWTAWMGEDPIAFGRSAATSLPRDDWFRLAATGSTNLTTAVPAPSMLVRIATPSALSVLTSDGVWQVRVGTPSIRLAVEQPAFAEAPPRGLVGGRLDHAARSVFWVAAGPPGHRSLGTLDQDGFHGVLPAPPAGSEFRTASPRIGAVFRTVDGHGVESLRLVRPSGDMRLLAQLNPELGDVDPLDIRPVRHAGPEGQPLTSWLILPPGACRGAGRPPLVVQPYLGTNHPRPPRDPYMETGFFQNFRVMTGHGYAVLAPSLPPPEDDLIEPGAGLAKRLLDIVDAVTADPALRPCVDTDRLALVGWSFGGYTTLEAITQTNRFRAAVSLAGISDFTAYWASLGLSHQLTPEVRYTSNWSTGNIEQGQPTFLGPPWANPERYRRNSPLYAADRIQTPVLLLHGWEDALPVAQSEALYSALFRQGKDAVLVTYWGMKHGPLSPGDVRDVYERTFDFLDRNLAGRRSRSFALMSAPEPEAPRENPGSESANSAPTPRP